MINEVDAAKATGTTRGVPANKQVAEKIKSTLERDDQVATEYLTKLQGEQLPPSYSYPPGSSKLNANLLSISTEIEFKRKTPTQGAKEFLDFAQKALGK